MAMLENSRSRMLGALAPVPTGGVLVVFKEDVPAERQAEILGSVSSITTLAGTAAASLSAPSGGSKAAALSHHFRRLGVAVVRPQQSAGLQSLNARLAEFDEVVEARPEFFMFAINPLVEEKADLADTEAETWGVAAVKAASSPYTGEGIKIAVLDTGFALNHPDFAGRIIVTNSTVDGETVDDVQGHGTHCIGTAAGPRRGGQHPRYGVAPAAEIYVCKVLNNGGSGTESQIIAGIDWAISEKCDIISMSLGRPTAPDEAFTLAYELIAKRALDVGCLIVAAAGNESSRKFNHVAPVSSPANCPSILAVGAVDQSLSVAEFSCGGLNDNGGQVDVSGPGVGVFSSVPLPQRYRKLMGTSMACPHVAGVAALWAQSDPSLRGRRLWKALIDNALALPGSKRDVGIGLAQAPQGAVAGQGEDVPTG
jgi:subtilisin